MKLTKEEARKRMEKAGFVEISEYEWLFDNSAFEVPCEEENLYFKPKEEFPIVFEDGNRRFEVNEDGIIKIIDTFSNKSFHVWDSLNELKKAIAKSDEIRRRRE